MQVLLAHDELLHEMMCLVLCHFTFEFSKELRKVCRAFRCATYDIRVKYQVFHALDATLHRLQRRYDLDEDKPWFAPVEQVVRTLYALEGESVIKFHLPLPVTPRMNVLGVQGMQILDSPTFRQTLMDLARAHPAFAGEKAGPYMFRDDKQPLAICNVLRDLGFRSMGPTNLDEEALLLHTYWFGFPLRETHPELIARLRELRAEAVVKRRRRREVALRLARLKRNLECTLLE
jgi:hypothetical protein